MENLVLTDVALVVGLGAASIASYTAARRIERLESDMAVQQPQVVK